MAVEFITSGQSGGQMTPLSFTIPGVVADDTLIAIAAIYARDNADIPSVSASIEDSLGNAWNQVGVGPYVVSSDVCQTWVWIVPKAKAGNCAFTFAFSPTSGNGGGLNPNYFTSCVVLQYRGLQASPFDDFVAALQLENTVNENNTWTGLTPGYVQSTSQQDLLIAYAWWNGDGATVSPAPGWTERADPQAGGLWESNLQVYDQTANNWGTSSVEWTAAAPNGGIIGCIQLGLLSLHITPAEAPSLITFPNPPGFFDISDAVLGCDEPLADYDLLKINYNARLAIVRPEPFFCGYCTDGAQLPLVTSPVDAYPYSLAETLYFAQLAATKRPLPGFSNEQETFPSLDYTGNPVEGFLCDPYVLKLDFGSLTQQGVSTAKQVKLVSEFYEHGSVGQNIPQQPYSAGASAIFAFGQRQSATMAPVLPGPVYQLGSNPVFYDLPDSAIYDDAPITNQMLQATSRNAKLGVFRFEIFWMGFYTDGDVVPTPYGAGNYAYSRSECIMMPWLASSRQPAGDFVPGQLLFPTLANLDSYAYPASAWPQQLWVDGSSGKVTCTVSGTNGEQGQGTVGVICFAQRYANLTMAAQPSYTEIPDIDLAAGQVPSAALLQALNDNAKFGIVAKEAQWLGFFQNGAQLPRMVSTIDQYAYSFFETLYIPVWVSGGSVSGLTPGQKTWPTIGPANSTNIVASPYENWVAQFKGAPGALTANTYDGNAGIVGDGLVSVYAIGCRRQNPTGTTLN